ncbi:hypothetical protein B7486_62385, partial [cyanobacterium TDX16]
DEHLRAALGDVPDRLAPGHVVLQAGFVTTWPGRMSGVGLHREATTTDEAEHRSLVACIPLDDLEAAGAGPVVAPGSHRWPSWDQPVVGNPDPLPADLGRRIAQDHSVAVTVPLGHALVHDAALLQHRGANRTDRPLLVVQLRLVPEGAATVAAQPDDGGGVRLVEAGPAHWLEHDPFLPTPGLLAMPRARAGRTAGQVASELAAALVAPASVQPIGRAPAEVPAAWCFRCGAVGLPGPTPDPWVGRSLALCAGCEAAEPTRHATPPPWHPVPDITSAPSTRRARTQPRREPKVLRDRSSDRRLRKDGYLRLPDPVLDPAQAAAL